MALELELRFVGIERCRHVKGEDERLAAGGGGACRQAARRYGYRAKPYQCPVFCMSDQGADGGRASPI